MIINLFFFMNEITDNLNNEDLVINPKIITDKKILSFWGKTRKWIFRLILIALLFMVISSASFMILVQYKGFRSWLSDLVLNIINKELVARVEISDIKINPFRGIEVYDIKLITDGDTLAFIPKLDVKFSTSMLLENVIMVRELTIDNPRIKLIRNPKDSTWNFSHIARPTPDDSVKKPFKWLIDVRKLLLTNSRITISDPLTATNDGKFSPSNLYLDSLNIDLKAKADFTKKTIDAEINNISFSETKSGYRLKNLAINLKIDTSKVKIEKLNINSSFGFLTLSGIINNFNLFDKIDSNTLNKTNTKLNLSFDNINLEFLSKFLSISPELNKFINFKADINGSLNDLTIESAKISKNGTVINLKGKVKNVTNVSSMIFTVDLSNSQIIEKDVKEIAGKMNLNLPNFNKLSIKNILASGNKDSIRLKLDISSVLGDVKGISYIKFDNLIHYSAELAYSNINLALILNNNNLISKLTGKINLNGSGTKKDNINTNVRLFCSDSYFNKYNIHELSLNARLSPDLNIMIDTLSLALYNHSVDSTVSVL